MPKHLSELMENLHGNVRAPRQKPLINPKFSQILPLIMKIFKGQKVLEYRQI